MNEAFIQQIITLAYTMILLFPVLGKNNQISWIPLRFFFFFFFKCYRSFSPYAHLSLVPWTLRMRFRTRSFSGRQRHECNITFSQLSNVLLRAQNLPFLSFYSQNMTLSTLLILEVCRTRVIYELHIRPCSPYSLCGSVTEHGSTESEGRGSVLHGHSFSLSNARDKTKNSFIYFLYHL